MLVTYSYEHSICIQLRPRMNNIHRYLHLLILEQMITKVQILNVNFLKFHAKRLVLTFERLYFCEKLSDLYFSAYVLSAIHTNMCDCIPHKVVMAFYIVYFISEKSIFS